MIVGRRRRWVAARLRIVLLLLALGLAIAPALPAPRPALARQDDTDLSGRNATIARSEDGVNLRVDPSFGGEVVGTLSDGTVVQLRIDEEDTVLDADGQTRWWPISADGIAGWVAGYYLNQDGAAATADGAAVAEDDLDADETAGEAPGGAVSGTTTTASVTAEDGANLRAEPGAKGAVVRILSFDTQVELRIDEADTVVQGGVRWWPVRVDGVDGWVAGDYLADSAGVVVDDSTDVDAPIASGQAFTLGEYVAAATDDGSGLNLRVEAGADFERIGVIPEGDVVQVMDGPFPAGSSASGWYLVTDGEVTGYVDGDFLAQAAQPAAPPADADPVVDQPLLDAVVFAAGETAAADDGGVNVRSGASLDSGLLKTLQQGDVVEVLAGPRYDEEGDGWYLVTDGATTGYANGNFLVGSSAPPPAEVEPGPPAVQEVPPAPAAGVATGAFIVPVAGYVFTQAYGCSAFVFEPYDANLGCNFHNGIDLANVAYTPLLAADGGVVKYAGWCDCGLGYFVEIDHGNGFSTVYGHMAEQPPLAAGQAISQGQYIGPMGSTGLSTGSHVHFMIKINGGTVDPLGYLPPV